MLAAWSPTPASALAVKTWNGPGTLADVNAVAPTDDPGWGNFGNNRTGVYLGDQWVISAKHAGTGSVFDTDGGSFPIIPNSLLTLTNPGGFGGSVPSSSSDIVMFRVGLDSATGMTPEELGARVITIADRLPTASDVLTMIGRGKPRSTVADDSNGQRHWNYDPSDPFAGSDGLVIDFDDEVAEEHGFFLRTSTNVKTWGTNTIASPSSVPGTVRQVGDRLLIEANGINDVVGYVTRFDRGLDDNGAPISDGSTPDEAQGTGDDSGGPVFFKDDGEWVLSGVMHAIYPHQYSGQEQSLNKALFGAHTAISDLSHPHYSNQLNIIRSFDSYSVMGDLDLDGEVDGEIVNGVATGDLGILVQNWENEEATADIKSWIKGDLNQDGLTNLADFVLLRDALGGTISVSEFSLLVAGRGVPEPTSLGLAALALSLMTRRRVR